MQKFSYHTHTTFSDGKNTLDEMLQQAVNLGWKEIGISDHLIIHKNVKKSPFYHIFVERGVSHVYRDDFDKARKELIKNVAFFRETAAKYPIKVYLGYEVDFFTYKGWLEEFKDLIKEIDHDYLITGNHYFMSEDGEDVFDAYFYENAETPEGLGAFETLLRRHYETIAQAVSSGLFTFLAHLDYARRNKMHKFFPMIEEQKNIVHQLKKANIACELSTKGLRRINDFFPSEPILKELIAQNVPIVISDDAHYTTELGIDFDKAEAQLELLGCQNRFHLKSCS